MILSRWPVLTLLATLGVVATALAQPAPWKQYLGANTAAGFSVEPWRATVRSGYPLGTNNAAMSGTIDPARLDEVLAAGDWINLQDGYNYRDQTAVSAFFNGVRADHGAAWRANCTKLAQAMVDGQVRNAARGTRAWWELGNEIYAENPGDTIGAWIATNNLPYPHPGSPFNDNPAHAPRMNDRGIIGYQVEYQIALALEAILGVNATAPAAHKVRILSPASTGSSLGSGGSTAWTAALLNYVIVGYEMEIDASGRATANLNKPLAASLAGTRLGDLVDIVNVHYILGPGGATLSSVFDTWASGSSHATGVFHTEEGGINAADGGRGGVSAMSGFARATDVWLGRGLSPASARLVFYASNEGPLGTRGADAMTELHGFMPADTTVLARRPGLLNSGAATLESYTLENADGTKRALFLLPATNTTASLASVTMQAGGWTWTSVTGFARLWSSVANAAGTVTVTRAADGNSYTIAFPNVSFTGQNQQALVIFLAGSSPSTLDILTPASLPFGAVNAPYAQTLVAASGATTATWTVTAGALPPGLVLSSTGALIGTPTVTGTFNFTARAAAGGAEVARAFTLTINSVTAFAYTTRATLPPGTAGTRYQRAIAATGGVPPYTHVVTSGALPAGLSLGANTGGISGTPTVAGTFSFTATATDSTGATASRVFTVAIGGTSTGPGTVSQTDGTWEALVDGSEGRTTTFTSATGEVIPAYVRKPAGNGPFPLVIMAHGGGTSQSGTYALGRQMTPPTPNFIAAGFAIYSMDYSSTAGNALSEGEWELVASAIAAARQLPYVDPLRIAMVGQSHGGNLTCRAASHLDILCAVPCAPAGIDPLAAWRFQQRGGTIAPNLQGVINDTAALYKVPIATLAANPSAYRYRDVTDDAPAVRYPLFLVSGLNDSSSPPDVMEDYGAALTAAGKYFETYYPANGPHGFVISRPRIPETDEFARRAVAFLQRYFSLADTDGDQLPDGWELARFNNLAQDAQGDPDGDGQSNLAEYRGGTHPLFANASESSLPPVIITQPAAQNAVAGGTVTFTVMTASNVGNVYQWNKDGAPIAGATGATLTLNGLSAANVGAYAVVVTNAAGSVTSSDATLVLVAASAAGRLTNLSVRAESGSGDNTVIVGFVIGGTGTAGGKAVLMRGVGPTLQTFGVGGTLADPVLTVLRGSSPMATNDDWGGGFDFATVGAFAFSGPAPRDAAVYNPALAAGSYSIQIAGKSSATGVVLAEVYDATPASSFAAATPRLVNVSARTHVGTGDRILIAGFVVVGTTPVRVVVRAIGPGLASFGVGGTLGDPKLEIYRDALRLAENDNWSAADAATFASVGAFALTTFSRDAALVTTLQPGPYTVQVSGVGNTTGVALVEVYEIPVLRL